MAKQRPNRKYGFRSERPEKWLFVTEGKKTEPYYLQGLIDFLNANGNKKISAKFKGEGKNTSSLYDKAVNTATFQGAVYGKTIILFDKDDFGDKNFDETIKEAKMNYSVVDLVAWSNPCFELWLLLHFQAVDPYHALHRDACEAKLTEWFIKNNISDKYDKKDPNIFQKVTSNGGSIQKAMKNAKILCSKMDSKMPSCQNPMTQMHELVALLCRKTKYKF